MIQLASLGTLFCIVLLCWFLAEIIWSFERNRMNGHHLLHGPKDGCDTCADK